MRGRMKNKLRWPAHPRFNFSRLLLLLWVTVWPEAARAATRTWDGSANGLWSTSANWVEAVAPSPGDDLVFPAGALRLANTNNFAAGTGFRSIQINAPGYTLRGNRVELQNAAELVLSAANINAGTSTVELDLVLAGATPSRQVAGPLGTGSLRLLGNVVLGGHDLRTSGSVEIEGAVSGQGSLTCTAGTLILSGTSPNSYSGETTVASGNLKLAKSAGVTAVPGNIFCYGFLNWEESNQIADTATIRGPGYLLQLKGQSETVKHLHSSGNVTLDGGTLSLSGDLMLSQGSGPITLEGDGRLSFTAGNHQLICTNTTNHIWVELAGPGNLVQIGANVGGASALHLFASNSFTGTYSISNSVLFPRHANALGNGPAGTFALYPEGQYNGAGIVLMTNMTITGETLVLSSHGYGAYGTLASMDGTARWRGNIVLPGAPDFVAVEFKTINAGDTLILDGVISGTGSVLISPEDTGRVVMRGASPNTYTGETSLNWQGRLELAKEIGPAVPGDLRMGDNFADDPNDGVFVFGPNQLGHDSRVTISTGASLDLNGHDTRVGDLELLGGELLLQGGTLTLGGSFSTSDGNSSYNLAAPGRLQLAPLEEHIFWINDGPATADFTIGCEISGAASIVKLGPGQLRLTAANTFLGNFTVGEGFVEPRHNLAFGAVTAGTIVSNGATVLLAANALSIGDEPLELRGHGVANLGALRATATGAWSGPVSVTQFGSVSVPGVSNVLTLSGAITAPSQFWKRGTGRLIMSGSGNNSFPNGFVLDSGSLSLSKTGGAVALSGFAILGHEETPDLELCELFGPGQFDPGLSLAVPDTARLDLNGYNSTVAMLWEHHATAGLIELGSGTLAVEGAGSKSSWRGIISGTGGVTIRGDADLALTGPNTYRGTTLVQKGVLRVRGHQPNSPVVVLSGSTLTGDGTVGHLTVNQGGTVRPGYFTEVPATLTCSNLVMQPGSTNHARILGQAEPTHLNTRGTVTLNQPTLRLDDESADLAPYAPYLPQVGDEIIPIMNEGTDPVNGQFVGLPPGSFTGLGGWQWDISYTNDVVLRVLSQGLSSSVGGGSNHLDILISGGNGDSYLDPNECAQLRIPIFNETSSNLPPFTAFLQCNIPGVTIHQPMAHYPALLPGQGAYGTNTFQITTPPGLFCGSNLPVRLVVQMAGVTPYAIAPSVFIGSPEVAVRFDATDLPHAINDGATVESTLNVDDFPGWLARIEVELHAIHALSRDLQLTLVAPDGLEIPLARGAGSGANYGTSCADGGRTRFSMAGVSHIGNAVAPFVGTFRPDGNLNLLRGRAGGQVAGKWTLRVRDEAHLNTGQLLCWSLYLSPTTCTDGGGACTVCPGLVEGQLNTDDPLIAKFPSIGAMASVAYSNTPCTSEAIGNRRVDRYDYTNHLAAAACITATVTTDCTNNTDRILVAAFAGEIHDSSSCQGFLGASGQNYQGERSQTFQFIVPPGTNLQIAVTTSWPGEGCKGYSLLVDGVGLCPVPLSITALTTNRMRLDWPDHAAGYELQRTATLQPAAWTGVATKPIRSGGRFIVTNEVNQANGAYRLRKP